jgi:uncharacterized protein (DUF2147 family)
MINGLIAAGGSLLGAAMRNKAAKAASARQMVFQEDMSNTSYQRGMADMKKAGLNPILAGKVGGASTPTGSTYNPENIGTNAVNSYLQTKQNEANVANTKAMTNKIKAETALLESTKGSGLGKTGEYVIDKASQGSNSARNLYDNLTFYEGEISKEILEEKGFIPFIPSNYKKIGGYYMVNPINKKDKIFIPFEKKRTK